MTTPPHAEVEIGHQLARVKPNDVRRLIAADLVYSETEFLPGGPLGHQMRRRGRMLHQSCPGGFLVPAGLALKVVDRLRQAGCQVTVRDRRRFGHKTTPDLKALAALPGEWEDQEFMRAVARQPRGLIEARGAADLTRQIALVCRLFPLANVLVVWNAGRRTLSALRSRLQHAVPAQEFRVVDDYAWPYESGRLVCSQRHFGMNNGLDFDVVVFLDAVETLSPSCAEGLGRLQSQRVYGFTSPQTPISGRALLRLQAIIGPYVWQPPDPQGNEAKVRVAWCKPPWSPAPGRGNALERKRTAYWHNNRRNDFLANVGRALASGDQMRLGECGLMPRRDGECSASVPCSPPAYTILVESTEHGRELLRRLRGWEMIDAMTLAEPSDDIWKPRSPLTIVTYSAAVRMPQIDADVLIHAGGEYTPALYGFPPRSHRPQGEVVLVDLADDCDAVARDAARRRQRDYVGWGWRMVGAPVWMREPGDGGCYGATGRPWAGRGDDET